MRGRPPRPEEQADRLGRFLALVLRHKPDSIGISLDPSGFVELEALAAAIAAQPGWSGITETVLRAAAQQDAKRYEIDGSRVRARYGHSIPIETPGQPVIPPEWLYHGAPPDVLDAIRSDGLKPQGRQFVHLSATRQDALTIGQRHDPGAIVVTVLARQAHEAGVEFFQASPAIYLARAIPAEHLNVPSELPS